MNDNNHLQETGPSHDDGDGRTPALRHSDVERFLQLQESEMEVRLREADIRSKEVDL